MENASDTKSEMMEISRETLDGILAATETATIIVSDVLMLEKIEQGKLEIQKVPFRCERFMNMIFRQSQPDLSRKNQTLEITNLNIDAAGIAEDDVVVTGDKHRITQIVSNFMSNASKFTRPGGNIRAAYAIETVISETTGLVETFLQFEVQDSGAGIDKEDQKKLFKKFLQLRAGELQSGGGSGLGLVICKQIAKLHGGDVGCESDGAGKGSTFWCRVKVTNDDDNVKSPPATTAKTPRGVAREIIEEGNSVDDIGKLNVLIVDDQKMNTKLLKRMVKNLGVSEENIVCCYDGVEAVEIYEQRKENENENGQGMFDVVFLDHEMPRKTGSEVTSELRGKGFEGRIVGVTGNAGTVQKENFLSSGADEIIVKPMQKEAIEAVLNGLVGWGGDNDNNV
ncbi:hypothetical protein ScalyP_jg2931 [Parmales sp. scaly parma]|nr:hypothetical protein ScalyP_jg2931 [Parmales sp. scaly parma]